MRCWRRDARQFETEVYQVDVVVGGVPLAIEAGVLLPPLLRMALSVMCPDGWIIGAALFRDRVVTLDLAASVLHLAQNTTPAVAR